MTPLDELILATGCLAGICCGAIPAIVGALKRRLGLGLMGFIGCSFAGCAFGLLGGHSHRRHFYVSGRATTGG